MRNLFLVVSVLLSFPVHAEVVTVQPVEELRQLADPDRNAQFEKHEEREREEAVLRAQTPERLLYRHAILADVIDTLASTTNPPMQHIPPSADDNPFSQVVSMDVVKNRYEALQMLCRTYGIDMVYDDGVWKFRPRNDLELIGRVYHLHHNLADPGVSIPDSGGDYGGGSNTNNNNNGSNGGSIASTFGQNRGSVTENQGGGNGRGEGQQAKGLSVIAQGIAKILGLPLTGGHAAIAGGGSVDGFSSLADYASPDELATGLAASKSKAQTTAKPAIGAAAARGTAGAAGTQNPNIIEDLDNNSIYVFATLQQHEYIEDYLRVVDVPVRQIALEVKFLDTTFNPKTQFGTDWSGTTGAFKVNATGLSTSVDLSNLGKAQWPNSVVISTSDVNLIFSALDQRSDAKIARYPRILTPSNRPARLESVVQQPVLGADALVNNGSSTTSSSIQYISIGTIVDMLPRVLGDNQISLNSVITISDITGTTIIQGNSYPIASTREIDGQAIIAEGQTMAIGGLDEALDNSQVSKLPWLGDIPFFGYFFKSKEHDRTRHNLMMFITPHILEGQSGGVTDMPNSVLSLGEDVGPRTSLDDIRQASLVELDTAVDGIARGLAAVQEAAKESLTDPKYERLLRELTEENHAVQDRLTVWHSGLDSDEVRTWNALNARATRTAMVAQALKGLLQHSKVPLNAEAK